MKYFYNIRVLILFIQRKVKRENTIAKIIPSPFECCIDLEIRNIIYDENISNFELIRYEQYNSYNIVRALLLIAKKLFISVFSSGKQKHVLIFYTYN